MEFRRGQSSDVISVQRVERDVFLFSVEPHSGAGLHGNCSCIGFVAIHWFDVFHVAMVWKTGGSLWRKAATGIRTNRRSNWFCLVRRSVSRRQLLDDILSGSPGAWVGYDDNHRAPHDYGHEFGR